jgi:uncharacterized protein with HEPN domain
MNRIETYTSDIDFETFRQTSLIRDAVVRNFEIIGEAVKNISDSFTSQHPEIPWSQMYRLRTRVSHEYFGIDYEVFWRIAKEYLRGNKAALEKLSKTHIPLRHRP